MRVELKNLPDIEVDVDGLTDAAEIADRIAAAPGIDAVVLAIAKGTWYARYEKWDDMSKDTAKDIAGALFDGGPLEALGKISDLVEDSEREPESEFLDAMDAKASGEFNALVDAVVEHLEDLGEDVDEDDVRGALKESLREDVSDKMAELDESKETDVVPDHVRVEIVHYFGLEGLAVDDRYMQNVSNVFEIGTVIPDERFAALFEGLNVDFAGFRQHVLDEEGFDLSAGPGDETLVARLTAADYIGDRDRARERAVERARAWQEFAPKTDPDRPAMISNADLATVINESGGGGLPCFVARVKLKDLLEHDWETPLRFDPTLNYGERTGGFVGIYDPVNGSGYIERPSAPVEVPAGTQDWRVSGRNGYEVDQTFGIVGTCYYADMTALPAPEPEPEAPAPGM